MRVAFLGGGQFQLAAIKKARESGHYVIVFDMYKDCPASEICDTFFNVSTTDIPKVIDLCERLEVHGIIAYASDPAAFTAAVVANHLGLVGNPIDAVSIMTNKDLYRSFLARNGFSCPRQNPKAFPKLVKPVDSSGSKGISIVRSPSEFNEAKNVAVSFSRCGRFLTEEFIERDGYQIAGDGFVVNGILVFRCFANEHFDFDEIVPVGESFPYIGSEELQQRIHNEIQRFIGLIDYENGALNFDIFVGKDEKIYLMEVGPRNGGNLISEATKYATGVDLIDYTIKSALGQDCGSLAMKPVEGFWATYMIHSLYSGLLKEIKFVDGIEKNIVEKNIFVGKGQRVDVFTGSNRVLGTLILKFDSQNEMLVKMDHMLDYIKVDLL